MAGWRWNDLFFFQIKLLQSIVSIEGNIVGVYISQEIHHLLEVAVREMDEFAFLCQHSTKHKTLDWRWPTRIDELGL